MIVGVVAQSRRKEAGSLASDLVGARVPPMAEKSRVRLEEGKKIKFGVVAQFG